MLIFPVSLTVMIMAPLGGSSPTIWDPNSRDGGFYRDLSDHLLFRLLGVGVSDGAILLRQVLLGFGIALFAPANNSAIIGSLPKEKIGLASSFLALSRNLGMVIGIAFAEMIVALSGPRAGLSFHQDGCQESFHPVPSRCL